MSQIRVRGNGIFYIKDMRAFLQSNAVKRQLLHVRNLRRAKHQVARMNHYKELGL